MKRKYQILKHGKPIEVDDKIYNLMVQILTDDMEEDPAKRLTFDKVRKSIKDKDDK